MKELTRNEVLMELINSGDYCKHCESTLRLELSDDPDYEDEREMPK